MSGLFGTIGGFFKKLGGRPPSKMDQLMLKYKELCDQMTLHFEGVDISKIDAKSAVLEMFNKMDMEKTDEIKKFAQEECGIQDKMKEEELFNQSLIKSFESRGITQEQAEKMISDCFEEMSALQFLLGLGLSHM